MVGKIFGCGLYRTGTTSLQAALLELGYRVVHHLQYLKTVENINRMRGRCLLWGIEDEYDVFLDGLLMNCYAELDQQYPGSRFICTMRDEDSWVRSTMRRISEDCKRGIYQKKNYSEDFYRQHHRQHYAAVKEYFTGRLQDVLFIDITKGQGWLELCRFLDKPIPDQPFPRVNSMGSALDSFWNAIQ